MTTDQVTDAEIAELIERLADTLHAPAVEVVHRRRLAKRRARRQVIASGVFVVSVLLVVLAGTSVASRPDVVETADPVDSVSPLTLDSDDRAVSESTTTTVELATTSSSNLPPASEDAVGQSDVTITDPAMLAAGYAHAYETWASDITACMREAGHEWTERSPRAPSAGEFVDETSSVSVLESYGYGLSAMVDSHRTVSENDDRPAFDMTGMDEAQLMVLAIDHERCTRLAQSRTPLPDEVPLWRADQLVTIDVELHSDPKVIEAKSAWIRCMQQAGFPADSRGEVINELHLELRSILQAVELGTDPRTSAVVPALNELLRRERQIVEADLACEAESELADTIADVSKRLEDRAALSGVPTE